MGFYTSQLLASFLVVITLHRGWIEAVPIDPNHGVEFIILHNNDMHARFEQTGVYSNRCRPEDIASNRCYGGFARVAHEVRKFREVAKQPGGTPVLYLNAGDTYSGTTWFYIYRDNITTEFMNVLQPDAISLGNHEFDAGVAGIKPFLEKVTFPVLVANLDLSKAPELASMKALRPSTVFNISGTQVGIIGYLTNETAQLSLTVDLSFLPEVDAINKEAEILKGKGVNIIIALGHSGFVMDQIIAMNCPLVDLVIGGHTNTFLYNGEPPDAESPEGPYPKMITQPSGKKVPVVQAYAYTKYLGHLNVQFDAEGNLIDIAGNPILLNGVVPQDSDVLQLLERYRPGVVAQEQAVVGYTKVFLDGSEKNCREKECNMGNMIVDSMVYARTKQYQGMSDDFWTDTAIGFLQGGGVRSSISKRENGEITQNDLMEVLPYNNKLFKAEVRGKTIRDMLNLSASRLGYGFGGFLQMSGVHVVYDANAPADSRVKSVRVLCAKCNIPQYEDLDDEKSYNLVLTDYLLAGGDGYNIEKISPEESIGVSDLEATVAYVKARSPIYPGVEWRIRIQGEVTTTSPSTPTTEDPGDDGVAHIAASGLLILVTLLLHLLS